jgi:hypothetical protein
VEKDQKMAKRRKRNEKKIYKYECTLTGEVYKVTEEAKNPDELMSVNSYYEMNPEEDDRPVVVKKQLGIEDVQE